MAREDKRFLGELRNAGRQAPVKFWRHMRSRTGRPRNDPVIKEHTTGRELDIGETIQFVDLGLGRSLQGAARKPRTRLGV